VATAQPRPTDTLTAEPSPSPTPKPTKTLTLTPTIQPFVAATKVPSGFAGPTPGGPLDEWSPVIRNFDGVEMVFVPPGCFTMGSDEGSEDERPAQEQCIEEAFWIDRTEVTNAQFGSEGLSSGPDYPRDSVTFAEAEDYCASRGGRLPTELEWEYAARGPNSLIYPWGDEFDLAKAVYSGNSAGQSAEVGSHPDGASWVGALDMAGNLWEWTSTIYSFAYPYSTTDGRENPADLDSPRVIRGGSYNNPEGFMRTTSRKGKHPSEEWFGYVGFRCMRPIGEVRG
jgi:formylglycine-generating enzyme required for sulfatase activity